MIPPLPAIRQRSIARWLKDAKALPAASRPAQSVESPETLDAQMLQAFDEAENAALDEATRKPNWGTLEATQAFNRTRLEAWQQVTVDFLPGEISAPSP